MAKKSITGTREEMKMITDFLISKGFTPIYSMEKSNWETDPFAMHNLGDGWIQQKNDEEWKCKEVIPRKLIEDNFEFVKGFHEQTQQKTGVRFCSYKNFPEVGISLASDTTAHYCTISSIPFDEKGIDGDLDYGIED